MCIYLSNREFKYVFKIHFKILLNVKNLGVKYIHVCNIRL